MKTPTIETLYRPNHNQAAEVTWIVNHGKTAASVTFRADGTILGNFTGGWIGTAEIERVKKTINFPALLREQEEKDRIAQEEWKRWMDDPKMHPSAHHSLWIGGCSQATFARLVKAAENAGYTLAKHWNPYCIQDGFQAGSWMIAPDRPRRG